jgi:hypothetical protein
MRKNPKNDFKSCYKLKLQFVIASETKWSEACLAGKAGNLGFEEKIAASPRLPYWQAGSSQ